MPRHTNPQATSTANPLLTQQLLAQVAHLRASGHPGRAAELCRQALARDPKNDQILHAQAALLCDLGWVREAVISVIQAGMLTRWQNPVVNGSFQRLVQISLSHEYGEPCVTTHARYTRWLGQLEYTTPRQVALLLDLPDALDDRVAVLDALLTQTESPASVLMPSDQLAALPERHHALPLQGVVVGQTHPLERLNALAAASSAEYILLCGSRICDAATLLSALRAPATADGWAMAYDPQALSRIAKTAITDCISGGYAVLGSDALGSEATPLLVARETFLTCGGLASGEREPWLDLTLKLLWKSEPLLQRMPLQACLPASSPSPSRTARIERYLASALNARTTPNPFAPASCNWGLYFCRCILGTERDHAPALLDILARQLSPHLLKSIQNTPRQALPGVNLIGSAKGELGLGENMRIIVRACKHHDIPCDVLDWPMNASNGIAQGDHSLLPWLESQGRRRCSVYFLQPGTRALYDGAGMEVAAFRKPVPDFPHYRIGYWYWELEMFPKDWHYALDKVDEIWVATRFVADVVRQATDKPVIEICPPISPGDLKPFQRADFQLPEEPFLFLFSFDYASYVERKNPEAVIKAFLQAFPSERKDVGLVIKCINSDAHPRKFEALMALVANDERMHMIGHRLTRDEVYGLQSVTDCFVSLHRSEGLGLGLAECMYQGKPVIATRYSGNLDFMNDGTALLVDYQLIPVHEDEYVHVQDGCVWADADVDHAALQMQRLVDEPGLAERLGRAARQHILNHFNEAATARKVRARLSELGML